MGENSVNVRLGSTGIVVNTALVLCQSRELVMKQQFTFSGRPMKAESVSLIRQEPTATVSISWDSPLKVSGNPSI